MFCFYAVFFTNKYAGSRNLWRESAPRFAATIRRDAADRDGYSPALALLLKLLELSQKVTAVCSNFEVGMAIKDLLSLLEILCI